MHRPNSTYIAFPSLMFHLYDNNSNCPIKHNLTFLTLSKDIAHIRLYIFNQIQRIRESYFGGFKLISVDFCIFGQKNDNGCAFIC